MVQSKIANGSVANRININNSDCE